MTLLNLAEEIGLEPYKTSMTSGGEYHCPCPKCGGKDRFILWPNKDQYWCRQCHIKGDSIQFCRDLQGLSYPQTLLKLQKNPNIIVTKSKSYSINTPIRTPSRFWIEKALSFVECSHKRLLIEGMALELLSKRGLNPETIQRYKLGWNPVKSYKKTIEWGIKEKETNEPKWLCFPKGLVLPIFKENTIHKIKIRKFDWLENDPYGKYYEIPGSSNSLTIFDDLLNDIIVITEAEFDAMLIMQETKNLCSCIALGGAQKRPDPLLHKILLTKKLILFALDFDQAGKKEYINWKKTYSNLEAWPVPEEKSPGDYWSIGGSIKDWVESGIKTYLNKYNKETL